MRLVVVRLTTLGVLWSMLSADSEGIWDGSILFLVIRGVGKGGWLLRFGAS